METIPKPTFSILASVKPESLIGKGMIYQGIHRTILDISLSGDRILLKKGEIGHEWILTNTVNDVVVLDSAHILKDADNCDDFTVENIARTMKTHSKSIGEPETSETKPLYEIVAALNKEVLRLDQEVRKMKILPDPDLTKGEKINYD